MKRKWLERIIISIILAFLCLIINYILKINKSIWTIIPIYLASDLGFNLENKMENSTKIPPKSKIIIRAVLIVLLIVICAIIVMSLLN